MEYNIIREYINKKIAVLNLSFDEAYQLKEDTVEIIDLSKLPGTSMDKRYSISTGKIKRQDRESGRIYNIEVLLNLSFTLYRKGITEYNNIIDNYIMPLCRLLRVNETAGAIIPYDAGNLSIFNLSELGISKLEELVLENYIQPVLNFTLTIIDGTIIDAELPEQVILTSPVTGSTVTGEDIVLIWEEIADVNYYSLIVYNDINEIVLHQTNIILNKFILPKTLLTGGETYSWKICAVNNVGAGEWSEINLFTYMAGAVEYDYDAEIYFYRTNIVPITDDMKAIYNTFVENMKSAGLWTTRDVIVLLAGENSQSSYLDFKNYFNASGNASPTFTSNRGYQFTATANQKIKTNFIPGLHGRNFTRDNNSLCLYIATNIEQATVDIGCADSTLDSLIILRAYQGGGVLFQGNCASATLGVRTNSDCRGLITLKRPSSTIVQVCKNGSKIGANETQVSKALPLTEIFIGARNYCISYAQNCDTVNSLKQYRYYDIGNCLSDADELIKYNIIQQLMTSIGANV